MRQNLYAETQLYVIVNKNYITLEQNKLLSKTLLEKSSCQKWIMGIIS